MEPTDDRPLCPRCQKNPVARRANDPTRLNKFCADRSCYDRLYDKRRDAAAKERDQRALREEALEEGNRYYKLMQKKVAEVVGTEAKGGKAIVNALPRGGALAILAGWERKDVLQRLARLDEAIRQAAEALGATRLRKHHALADRLREDRQILDLLSGDYLLSEIPDAPRK